MNGRKFHILWASSESNHYWAITVNINGDYDSNTCNKQLDA